MPIFEYACHDSGREFETLVRSGAAPACPQYHSTQLEKWLSVFATTACVPDAALPMAGPCGSRSQPEDPGSCALH